MPSRIAILSAVGGGPVGRLVDQLNETGRVQTSVHSLFSTVSWRQWRDKGGLRSLMIRLLVMFLYPWYGLVAARKADLLIATTNPFWMPNLALLARRFHNRPIITLVYDVYPDSVGTLTRLPRSVTRLMHEMNRHWMRRSDAVVFISRGMRRELVHRYGHAIRQRVIVTGVDTSEFDDAETQPDLDEWSWGLTMVSYVGNAGRVHDVETVSAVLRGVLRELPTEVAVFISASGERAPELRRAVGAQPHVRFEGSLDDDRWAWVQSRSDVAVVSLNDESAFSSMPSKYFSALGAGCAVFVVAPRSTDLYQLTERYDVGVAIEPGEPINGIQKLASLIKSPDHLKRTQAKARKVASENFDLSVIRETWLGLIDELLP